MKFIDKGERKYREDTNFLATSSPGKMIVADFIATTILVFIIIAPSSLAAEGSIVAKMGETKVGAAFGIASGILILILIFEKSKANMNPAVTTVNMFAGKMGVRYGLIKIFAQIAGAFLAATIVGAVAEHAVNTFDETSTLGANAPNYIPMGAAVTGRDTINMEEAGYASGGGIIVIIFEGIGTGALLYSVFSKDSAKLASEENYISFAFRIFVILFITIFIVDTASSAGLNPARTLAPAVVAEAAGGYEGIVAHSAIHLVGQMIAITGFSAGYMQKSEAKMRGK